MPPLAHQDSCLSIHSWWSDSNPGLRGPTINLHAAAKPLMRVMYRRQASEIIKQSHGGPLTTSMLDTYSSYFPWDFVSWSTKAAILSELSDRALASNVEARAVVDSPVFPHIVQILGSSDHRARSCSCRLLGNLASHESTAPAILELEPCEQLVFLLDDKHLGVIQEATAALSQLARWVPGARAVVRAETLGRVGVLLESSSRNVRKSTCELVGNLASHKSTSLDILKLNTPMRLVSLLGDEDSPVSRATYALSQIARWPGGAESVVDAKVLDHVLSLLKSPNLDTRRWACQLTANLAWHESTALAVLKLNTSVQLVSLLGDEDSVVSRATCALSQIARWGDGAKAMVDAKALDYAVSLLQSPNLYTQKWACELTGNLARHQSTAPAILKLNTSVLLVSLLGGEDSSVSRATYALSQIARWEDGAKAMVDAQVLKRVSESLKSPNQHTQQWTCVLVKRLANHEATALAILQLKLVPQLVSLSRDPHVHTRENAISALEAISQWSDLRRGRGYNRL